MAIDAPDWVRNAAIRAFALVVDKGVADRAGRLRAPDDVVMEAPVFYAGDRDPSHRLEIMRPANAPRHAPMPLIVDIHGGGWIHGHLDVNRAYCSRLAERGFAVANVDYRNQPDTDLRGQVRDLFAALHWLADHAGDERLDKSNVFLTGDSAGAHLALLVYCVNASARLRTIFGVEPEPRLAIRAIGLANGVVEGTYRADPPSPLLAVADRALLKVMCGGDPNAPWRPYRSYVRFAAGVDLPPMFVMTGLADPFYDQSARLLCYLRGRGIEFEELVWPNDRRLEHVFNITEVDWEESRRTNAAMCDFFARHLG
ncbi:alpha/beta hydrolase [Bifidobacterium vespertilionis]|uniref:Alpha/beta hydrolase n=1 Tax=Bifidobacterium vespertilionis TaxID=2562524 RepID=A0A5J5E0W0_9BIFI|nr:alpha/beta hydrolase [Bifidobacterium vespertilionis]KAA8822630.1 alpha/beta hydrolase [Bifidobacterium vespertilionis]KAA8824085.1 alpha/beta hydrolase [Bifidobacterium vespertilionis]